MLLKKSTSQVCVIIGRLFETKIGSIIFISAYPFVLFNPRDNHFVSLGDGVFFRPRHASLRRRFSATEKSHVGFEEIYERFDEREIEAHVVKILDDLFRVIRSFEEVVRLRNIEPPV